MNLNVADLIASRAEEHQERPALLEKDDSLSYQELIRRADDFAALVRHQLERHWPTVPKHRVGLFCPNGAQYVIAALGILRAGACFVPIASELAPPERSLQASRTALHLILSIGPNIWPDAPMGSEETAGFIWHWSVPVCAPSFCEERFAALNPAFIRFSSGTTGESKGVVLGHASLLERITSANRRLGISCRDRILWTLPMAHHFAVSIVLYLYEGATVLLEDSHLASDILQSARRHEATLMYGSPFHYALLAAERSREDWPSLRLAVSTAAALRKDTAASFLERFQVPLTQGLGVIEAGLPLLNTDAAATFPLSVGRPDDFEVSIRDECGNELTGGMVGELFLRGPGFFDAYLLPWREREEVIPDGWFATGDLAQSDASGQIFLKGRCKSVINVGGMKFFPEEVEDVLNGHPAVGGSRVFSAPHERWQSVPVAEIVPSHSEASPSPAALSRYCRERLASYKVPVRFVFVSEIPLTASGKVKR